MPDLVTHVYFAKSVMKELPDEIAAAASRHPDAFALGSIGPDYLFALREMGDSLKRYPNTLQYRNQYEVFVSIGRYLEKYPDPVMLSYALGFACHYAADRNVHPYVNALCEEYVCSKLPGGYVPMAHTLIEQAIDEYIVREKLGYGENSGDYNFGDELKSKRSVRKKIGRLYMGAIDDIMGIKLTEAKASLSFEITRLSFAFTRNKNGKRKEFFDKLENKFNLKKQFSARCRPPFGYGEIDYFNLERKPFRIVRNKEETSTATVFELFEKAKSEAATYYVPALFYAATRGIPLDRARYDVNFEGVATE